MVARVGATSKAGEYSKIVSEARVAAHIVTMIENMLTSARIDRPSGGPPTFPVEAKRPRIIPAEWTLIALGAAWTVLLTVICYTIAQDLSGVPLLFWMESLVCAIFTSYLDMAVIMRLLNSNSKKGAGV